MTTSNHLLLALGWTLRVCALICIVWTATQVASGAVATLPAILSAVAFHGACAVTGVSLVGQARRHVRAQAAA